MRSTADLIRELNAEAPKFWLTYLVVGFEKTTEFISAADHDGHRKLNDCLQRGGEPVGLIGIVKEEDRLRLYSRKLQEYIEDAWVDDYLDRLHAELAKGLIAKGAALGYKSADGWMQ